MVFSVAAGLIAAFVAWGAIWTEAAGEVLGQVLEFITTNFGWLMIGAVALFVIFCIWLVFSDYAKVRLGPDDSRPDYSYPTWFAMLFSAGMGIGLVFWGVAEPMLHYGEPPRQSAETSAAALDAMVLTYHHWGFLPWGIYAVLGLSLAYFGFRHNLPLTVRAALYPLIGDRIHGPIGNTVDILAILGTMIGVAVSLGLGVMQVNAGLNIAFDLPQNTTVQVLLIAGITLVATISVVSGLDKGIRRLSQANLVLGAVLLAFVALVGPTVVLVSAYFENLGAYLSGFLGTLMWTGAYGGGEESDWLSTYTLFYWAWWISWAPFVGMFIARISRGRTIREFVLGVLLVPTLVSFLWFTVMGNTALTLELRGEADILSAAQEGPEFAMFAMLEQFPLATLTAVLTMIVVTVFFVTSSDSGSFVIDILASGGNPNPPVATRIFWALSEGLVATVLLLAGGDVALEALQAGAVSTGLPFALVMLVVVAGLIKGLRSERPGRHIQDIPASSLIESNDGQEAPAPAEEDGRVPTSEANPPGSRRR